jgi:hypothetical protein
MASTRYTGTSGRLGLLIVLAVAGSIGATGPVDASHSAAVPRSFWDFDHDAVADNSDSIIGYSRGGGLWNAGNIARVQEAAAAWSTSTDWNPFINSNATNYKIYVDGTAANGTNSICVWPWVNHSADYALHCRNKHWHQLGVDPDDGYYHITDADLFLNEIYYNFDWGTSASGNPSGRGVVTHELGHGAYLWDVGDAYCGSPESRCVARPTTPRHGTCIP